MSTPRRFTFSHFAVFGVLACAVVIVFLSGVMQTPFDVDESAYLNRSVIAEHWLALDFRQLAIRDQEALLVAPLTPLLGGLSRLLAGAPVGGPYVFPAGQLDSLLTATMPAPRLLLIARLPIAMAGITSTLLLTALVWRAFGALTGVITGAMLLANTTYTGFNRQLTTEAPLLAFSVLAFIVVLRSLKRPQTIGFLGAGAVAGLAMASKHTGLLTVVASAATIGLGSLRGRALNLHRVLRPLYAVAAAAVIMIALNPIAWANPPSAVVDIAEERFSITAKQREDFPTSALLTPLQRLDTFVWRIFTHGATIGCARAFDRSVGVDPETNQWRYGTYVQAKLFAETPLCQPWLGATPITRPMTWINLALFAAGIAIVAQDATHHRLWELWAALGWVALYMGVTVLVVQFSWFQYYALPLVFATLLQAVAIGAGAQWLIDLARHRWGRVGQP